LTSVENQWGHLNSALPILLYITVKFLSWNGRYPTSSTKRMTPQDQISAFAPS
jgi:hypothetical protein